MAETARERMVRGYANAIYLDGTRSFATVGTGYHVEVKTYAANNFTLAQIDAALGAGRITEAEYLDTLGYRPQEGSA
ncbi:MAG: hypothetical protein J7559_02630 [Cohnella sp.]|nr:hypothetical protein [Cohnella sp.]